MFCKPNSKIFLIDLAKFMESSAVCGQLLHPPNPPPGQTSIECVINLEITDFSSRNKKHKVVISGPTADKTESISYKAKTPNKPPGAFDWRAGYDGGVKGFINYWGLAPLPMGTNFQREGNAYIRMQNTQLEMKI